MTIPAFIRDRVNTLPGNNPKGDNRKVGVTWGQTIGREECPYMKRWVLNFGLGSLRVHHWYRSDDPRHGHDHPWWFLTFVVKGGYTDIEMDEPHLATHATMPSGNEVYRVKRDHLRAPTMRFRPALHVHTVEVDPGGCWTVMLTGPHSRDWGFWVNGTWKRMRAYFRDHDHHPCED